MPNKILLKNAIFYEIEKSNYKTFIVTIIIINTMIIILPTLIYCPGLHSFSIMASIFTFADPYSLPSCKC